MYNHNIETNFGILAHAFRIRGAKITGFNCTFLYPWKAVYNMIFLRKYKPHQELSCRQLDLQDLPVQPPKQLLKTRVRGSTRSALAHRRGGDRFESRTDTAS